MAKNITFLIFLFILFPSFSFAHTDGCQGYLSSFSNCMSPLYHNFVTGSWSPQQWSELTVSLNHMQVYTAPSGGYKSIWMDSCYSGCYTWIESPSVNGCSPEIYQLCDTGGVHHYFAHKAGVTVIVKDNLILRCAHWGTYGTTDGGCGSLNCDDSMTSNYDSCSCECPPSPGCPGLCMEWKQVGQTCQCACPVDTHIVDGVCVPDGYDFLLNQESCELCQYSGDEGQCGYYDILESNQNPVWYPFKYPTAPPESEMVYGYRANNDYESEWYCMSGNSLLQLENYNDRDYLTRTELVNFLKQYKDEQGNLICNYTNQTICVEGDFYDVKAFFIHEDFRPLLVDECEGLECEKSKEGYVACKIGECAYEFNFTFFNDIKELMHNKFPFAFLYLGQDILDQFANIAPSNIILNFGTHEIIIPGYDLLWIKRMLFIGLVFAITNKVIRMVI
jgi:hypothetical protein